MKRVLPLVVILALLPSLAWGQMQGSSEAKIRSAMSAAPASISASATIMDWPAREGAQPVQLRAGTNGWVCYPDRPDTEGNDPMCLDEVWQKWVGAWAAKAAPQIDRVGLGYMAAEGGAHGSNTDPYASQRTADNEWGHDPPHLMILVPDPAALQGLPTARNSGGPWVMFRGTPYAHIMVPLETTKR